MLDAKKALYIDCTTKYLLYFICHYVAFVVEWYKHWCESDFYGNTAMCRQCVLIAICIHALFGETSKTEAKHLGL